MIATAKHDRIVSQQLRAEGVMTEFESGRKKLLPYSVDENGEEFVDLDPNGELT